MIKWENRLSSTYIVISTSSKKHQCNAKTDGGSGLGNGIPYSLIVSPPQNAYKLQQQTNSKLTEKEPGRPCLHQKIVIDYIFQRCLQHYVLSHMLLSYDLDTLLTQWWDLSLPLLNMDGSVWLPWPPEYGGIDTWGKVIKRSHISTLFS